MLILPATEVWIIDDPAQPKFYIKHRSFTYFYR